jgi:hypothetical protein
MNAMNDETRFSAPWSVSLKVLTVFTCILPLATTAVGVALLPENAPALARAVLVIIPPALLIASLPFAILGYVLRDGELVIERLGWCNRINLKSVVSATVDPDAMRGSIRIFGSGGLFGFFGWFRNGRLGVYHAYCTDLKRNVVLKLADRTIVISPDDPNRFTQELTRRREFGMTG